MGKDKQTADGHATLVIEVRVLLEHFDASSFGWIEELKDKACEQGEVVGCTLRGLPPTLNI
jgi:hypothetical protein